MPSNQPAPRSIRVLVADSSVIHTELLAEAIAKDRRIRVVNLSTSSREVLRGVLEAEIDLLLISETLDQRPGGGLDVIRQIRNSHPDIKSIVLLDSSRRENVVQAFRAGARGVFCRNHPVKTLCKCIAAVNEGQIWANSFELLCVLDALRSAPSYTGDVERLSALSDRERDVVTCLAEGLSNREIATRLNISQHTVKNYMFRIFEKLGVSSRLELLFFVMSRADAGTPLMTSPGRAEVRTGESTIATTRDARPERKITAISDRNVSKQSGSGTKPQVGRDSALPRKPESAEDFATSG